MKNMLVCGLIAIVGAANVALAAGKTYYADANRGNDLWTGTADWEHRDETADPVVGPKQTLQAVLDLAAATSKEATVGDTVYLAEGDYNDGSSTSTYEYRGVVPDGCTLIGTDDKTKTFINGTDVFPCLKLGKWSMVKNVTICNGRFTDSSAGTAGQAAVNGGTGSYIVDCIVTNHYSVLQYGVFMGAVPIRCFFADTHTGATGTKYGNFTYGGSAFSCIFDMTDSAGGTYLFYSTTKTYNCTFVGGTLQVRNTSGSTPSDSIYNGLLKISDGRNNNLYSSVSTKGFGGNSTAPNEDCKMKLTEEELQLDDRYAPVEGCAAIDAGSLFAYTNAFPTSRLVADQRDLDFYGKPRFTKAGTIDAGAVQHDTSWFPLPEESGLTMSLAGQVLKVSRNYTSEKLVIGFVFNDEDFAFDDYQEGHVFELPFEGDISEQYFQPVYAEKTEWYVNPVTGNDANKGYGKYCAKKTLVSLAQTVGTVSDTNVIHLAAGEYREGIFTNTLYGMEMYYRLYVPAYTRVVCDDEPGSAIICGADATTEDKDENGNGADAVRCVCADGATGILIGCTLTGGRSFVTSTGSSSQAYHHKGNATIVGGLTIVDCVVTNNRCAARAAVSYAQSGAKAVRTYFANNKGSLANEYYMHGQLFDCVFADKVGSAGHNEYYDGGSLVAYNCLFVDGGHNAPAYNCIMLGACGNKLTGTNDLVTDGNDAAFLYGDRSKTITAKQVPYDENYRPLKTSLAVDAGGGDVYKSAIAAAGIVDGGRDFARGQRIYNGKIDIGPGEYDWRGDFAKTLAKKDVEVAAAGENVTTNLTTGLDVPAGNSLKLKLLARTSGVCSFKVTLEDGATVSVTRDGQPLEIGEDGLCTFRVADEGEVEVEVACAGEGQTTVSGFVLPKFGLMLLFR